MVADAGAPMVAGAGSLRLPAEAESLLPPPEIPADQAAALPNWPFAGLNTRPAEETMLSSWASRDPEGAGRWLSQNRQHPKFADMVRGYAIQISTIDPAAARQWAAELKGKDNRFAHGGTLEQHIDAVEAMLNGTSAPEKGNLHPTAAGFAAADYTPVLVRQHPDEPPVLQMQPTSFT